MARRYSRKYKKRRSRRRMGRTTLNKKIKRVIDRNSETKVVMRQTLNTTATCAGFYAGSDLIDVEQGNQNHQRVGDKISVVGHYAMRSYANASNNPIYIRSFGGVLKLGKGTLNVDGQTDLWLSPQGTWVAWDDFTANVNQENALYYKLNRNMFDVLYDKITFLPRHDQGGATAKRIICKSRKKFTCIFNDTNGGELAQSHRVFYVIIAWCPHGGDQSSYGFFNSRIDATYYKDM